MKPSDSVQSSKHSYGVVVQGVVEGTKARIYGIASSINASVSNDNDDSWDPNSTSDPMKHGSGHTTSSDDMGNKRSDDVQNSRSSPDAVDQGVTQGMMLGPY